jgi:DNA replication initiation complex subunit (GINS family)
MEKKEEKMSYDLIYQVYQRERQGAALSKVEKDFYEKVGVLIKGLKEEYDSESKTNPSSTKCMLLYDELKKVRTLFLEIYEYRIRKVALMALTGASEGSVDIKSLVGMENGLFEQLMVTLRRGYEDIGRVELGGVPAAIANVPSVKAEPGALSPTGTTPHPKETTDEPVKDIPVALTEPVPVKKKKLVAVQILEDIPKFAGEGGEVYILKKKDYASLPQVMAERLEKTGKARIMPT